jgi:NAD(P)-dependent dehydrogenase (short-subunit alcohol dehydrogenase family)
LEKGKIMKLKNKVAIVTGGASGQGRAIAKLFAREGADVVVADVDIEGAEETARQVSADANQASVLTILTDVSSEPAVEALISETVSTLGTVDILVNCAGRLGPSGKETADQLTIEEWEATLSVNLLGPWLCIKYAAPVMQEHGGGSIINVASTAGLRPFPGAAPYCVSKAGLLMLTKTVALEYVSDGIRVTAICPGHVDTPMMDAVIADMETEGLDDAREQVHAQSNPMGRLGTPEEVATVALFLASEDASFVTGSYVLADGGYMAG